jgi:hypothetical protein
MDNEEAIRIVFDAANNWADYLEENDRNEELEELEEALRLVGLSIKESK